MKCVVDSHQIQVKFCYCIHFSAVILCAFLLLWIRYAGRLSKEKGLPFLAKVLADPRIKGKVHLALIGDGPIRHELETKDFSRVKADVSFHGFMSHSELALAYLFFLLFILFLAFDFV